MTVPLPIMSDEFLSRLDGMKPTDRVDVTVYICSPQGSEVEVGRAPEVLTPYGGSQAAVDAVFQALMPLDRYLTAQRVSFDMNLSSLCASTTLTANQIRDLAQQPYVRHVREGLYYLE